nr:MAG TPA: hypothetical protein [Caudoviricetes sp.]
MERLTSQRCSGIKSGYWSTAKKDELIQRLGQYEDTGLTPEEITARLSAQETMVTVPVIEPDKLAAYLERGKDDRFQTFSPD